MSAVFLEVVRSNIMLGCAHWEVERAESLEEMSVEFFAGIGRGTFWNGLIGIVVRA